MTFCRRIEVLHALHISDLVKPRDQFGRKSLAGRDGTDVSGFSILDFVRLNRDYKYTGLAYPTFPGK